MKRVSKPVSELSSRYLYATDKLTKSSTQSQGSAVTKTTFDGVEGKEPFDGSADPSNNRLYVPFGGFWTLMGEAGIDSANFFGVLHIYVDGVEDATLNIANADYTEDGLASIHWSKDLTTGQYVEFYASFSSSSNNKQVKAGANWRLVCLRPAE